jgi:outer membrane protein TolC
MLQAQIKRRGEHIFRFKSGIIVMLQIGIIFYFLSFSNSLPYKAFTAYSAESASDKKIIKKNLEDAEKYYKDGLYDMAIKLWDDVLRLDPENRKAQKRINTAKKKIAKINVFFGKDVFKSTRDIKELSLRNCIEMAGEASLKYQIAKGQIDLARIKVWEARRNFLPSLTLSWVETKGIQSGGKIESLEYGIEGKQPAFHSGELMYALAKSKSNLKIAERNYDRVKMELYFEVREAYYNLVKTKKFLEYVKALYEDVKPLYKMAQKEHEKGVTPDIERLNAESNFNKIYYKSISSESDLELARLALQQKLNIEDGGHVDIALDIPQKSVNENINTCISLAVENRPDLKMSELTVKSTEYDEKIAKTKEMPRVDLTGHYKMFSEVYRQSYSVLNSSLALDPHKRWYAGLEVIWPFLGSTGTYSLYKRADPSTLSTYDAGSESKGSTWKLGVFDNLKSITDAMEAEVIHVRAEEELNDTRKKVVMEVKEAFYAYEKTRVQLEAAKVQREFYEKEAKILKVKHGFGETELSELFESITSLMQANESYFEAEKDLNISVAELNRAIGVEDYF